MNKLVPIEHKNQRILTTAQVAEVFGTDTDNMKHNFNNNQGRFIEGVDYYCLRGGELRDFLRENEIHLQISTMTRTLYLWTERGTFKHMKMIGTDEAWAGYDILLDTYFKAKEMLPHKPDSYMIENPAERARRWAEEYEEKLALESTIEEQQLFIEELTDCDKKPGEYEAYEIARKYGIYSKAGKPHSKLIGGIRTYLGNNPEHFRVVKTQQGSYYANSYYYNEKFIEAARDILESLKPDIGELKLNTRFYYRCA